MKRHDNLFAIMHFCLCIFIIVNSLFVFKTMFPEGFTVLHYEWLNQVFNVIFILIFGIAGIAIYFIIGTMLNKCKDILMEKQ